MKKKKWKNKNKKRSLLHMQADRAGIKRSKQSKKKMKWDIKNEFEEKWKKILTFRWQSCLLKIKMVGLTKASKTNCWDQMSGITEAMNIKIVNDETAGGRNEYKKVFAVLREAVN